MVSKSFAVLFVALFAFQASEANVIDDIISQMGSSMNQTMKQIKENLAEMERAASNVIDGIQGKIQDLEDQAAESIQKYAEQAQQLDANITECQNAAQEALDKVKNASTSGIRECLSTLRQTMQPDLDLLDGDMQEVQAFATEAAKNFSACGFINPSCQMKVITEAAKQAGTLGSKVMSDGTTFAQDFAPAESQFNTCAQAEISSAVSTTQETIQEEIQCIQEKIQEASSQ
ncbi:apolipoprotein E [Anabrus simplex]|uniref:apolipoprotein E n=1 Tax=Anabrus simplex TaxID=316456 RepID=UPI0034DCCFE6